MSYQFVIYKHSNTPNYQCQKLCNNFVTKHIKKGSHYSYRNDYLSILLYSFFSSFFYLEDCYEIKPVVPISFILKVISVFICLLMFLYTSCIITLILWYYFNMFANISFFPLLSRSTYSPNTYHDSHICLDQNLW